MKYFQHLRLSNALTMRVRVDLNMLTVIIDKIKPHCQQGLALPVRWVHTAVLCYKHLPLFGI
jgi:hypothetical protein